MSVKRLIECVPNFSEGKDLATINKITAAIAAVDGVKLLNVDPGKATNRTVVTFVGEPQAVIEGAFQGIKKASELINMANHTGEHPRMGATDVCPFVPISGVTLEEAAQYAHALGEKVGKELDIPVYMYEASATKPERKNLATIRSGEYEKFADKIEKPEWKPDYGPQKMNFAAGTTAIGARDFLIAYNVNLNTTSVRRANSIAFDVREQGRVKRSGNPITGPIVKDENGEALRDEGMCKSVKAIGWFIEEYGLAQISMNLTNMQDTSLHEAFEACRVSANKRGIRVTGSELVGLVPKKVMLDAGKYFLTQQERSTGISEEEIIRIAIVSLGLDELSPFKPKERIIEYLLESADDRPLVQMSLSGFANETASESVAPGGGSVSAYVGALGASLGTMVANLSAHKRGWDARWEEFSEWAETGEAIKSKLIDLVDDDTAAFNGILAAFRLPKDSDAEKVLRSEAIQKATKQAIEVPLEVMRTSYRSFNLLKEMVKEGNPASSSDAGVGALCARAAVHGAALNVRINLVDLKDEAYKKACLTEVDKVTKDADAKEQEIMELLKI